MTSDTITPAPVIEYPIDVNGFLRLRLTASETPGQLEAHLYSSYAQNSPLVKNILPLITIESHDKGGRLVSQTAQAEDFSFNASPEGGTFSLFINKNRKGALYNAKPFADFRLKDGNIDLVDSHRKLIVGETQIIGRSFQTQFPAPIDYSHIRKPTVDQHTHLSAQITSADLITLGLKHDIYYPTSILDKLHIEYPTTPKNIFKDIDKLKFLPYAKEGASNEKTERGIQLAALSENSRQALANAMSLTPEGQSTPEDMERTYFHREPFTKNIKLLPDILHKIAADYKRQGIKYAELSTNAILPSTNTDGTLNLSWLREFHRVMAEPDMDPTLLDEKGEPRNVMIRFRPGFPRNLGGEVFKDRVEKYKRIAEDPFIAGPDILGFEANKTLDMKRHLDELATWMKEHTPEDSIQIHAGENGKNPANVLEAIALAVEHDIRVLIGHAIYGIDDETLKLAEKVIQPKPGRAFGNLMAQFNLASNLAGGNIVMPRDVDASGLFNANIPCLNNSDGAGFYYTDAEQTAMMAAQCGFGAKYFDAIHATEEKYIPEQREVFLKKQAKLREKFPDMEDFYAKASQPLTPAEVGKEQEKPLNPELKGVKEEDLPPLQKIALAGMHPIFFGGAGGKGWDEMDDDKKKEFLTGFKMLLEHLDADKTYFLKGRTKDTGGIGKEMITAVQAYNKAHVDKPFIIGTLLAKNESTENHGNPGEFTLALPCTKLSLPSAIAKVVKERNGAAFFIGGKAITSNLIIEFNKQHIPFGLMDDEKHHETGMWKSASSSMARVFKEEAAPKHFENAVGMVMYAHSMDALKNLFEPSRTPDERSLNKMYAMLAPQAERQLGLKKDRDVTV